MKIKLNGSLMMLGLVAVFLVIAMLFIAKVHSYTSMVMLKHQFHEQGVALTRSISHFIWKTIGKESHNSLELMLKKYSYDELDFEIKRIIEGTPVLKLELYDYSGVLRYSSNKKDIFIGTGMDKKARKELGRTALDVAISNRPMASYRLRKTFDDGHRQYHNRYILSAYLPARVPDSNDMGGVVEIYYDVTDIITEFNGNRNISILMLVLVGMVLFILISYLILQNDKIVRHKVIEREKYLAMIESRNNDLLDKTRQLTDIKERTERLADDRSAFIARISHDLRTPMNAIIGLTDLVMRTRLTDKQRGYLNAIQNGGNILLDITDEVLTAGRLESGYMEINQQRYLLGDTLESVIEVMGNRASTKGLELICDFTDDIYKYVVGDPVRLRQILINLVGNAIKYTKEGCVIVCVRKIGAGAERQYYHFDVIDTGVGITEKDQQKIFSAYCSLHNQDDFEMKSSGLGLAISKSLVEAMQGEIGVTSEINRGATFWFRLPTHVDDEHELAIDEITNLDRQKMLIVVDHSALGQVLLAMITAWGMEAELAQSPEAAFNCMNKATLTRNPYTLFLIDSQLNDRTGLELAREIRQYENVKNVPIVLMVPISMPLESGLISEIQNILCINKPVLPGCLKYVVSGIFAGNSQHGEKNQLLELDELNMLKPALCNDYKILVVEDNPLSRELMLEMLAELNLSATGVTNGHAVLEAVVNENYELILLDYRLPDMEGHRLAAKIRQASPTDRQPVIVGTSSDNSVYTRQLCSECGVDDFLSKPIRMTELTACLFAWMPELPPLVCETKYKDDCSVVNIFSAPILDRAVISNLKKGNERTPDFFVKLIDIFIEDCFERMEMLNKQFEQADYIGMEKIIHSIKSGCIHVGAKRLVRYCDVLCSMVKNQRYSEIRRALQYFTAEVDGLVHELNLECYADSVLVE